MSTTVETTLSFSWLNTFITQQTGKIAAMADPLIKKIKVWMNKPETKWAHIKADRDKCSLLSNCTDGLQVAVVCRKEREHSCSYVTHKYIHTGFCPQSWNAAVHGKTCHSLMLHSAASFAQAGPGSIYGPSLWRQVVAVAMSCHSEEPAGSLE